ncbi:hypothetical protein AB7942_23960 [Neobacillus sp. BF23-41]|uniref:hypothetical protein n=1 Tax=Neobacillus sp. BF23-41 TaxID=3240280 RepID=UPI0034E428C1
MHPDIDELIEMCSSEKIREFRKHTKPVYKYMLCGIFKEIIVKGDYLSSWTYGQAKFMSVTPELIPNQDGPGYAQMKQRVIGELRESQFITPDRDSQVDMIIKFFRDYLNSYKENEKTLYLISEVKNIIDVKALIKELKGNVLKDHHWVDINFKQQPIVPTFPEFFNYLDLINLWNDFILKYEKAKQLAEKEENTSQNPEWRELDYSYSASLRTLVILSVNFVEAYLYYYFYNMKQEKKYNKQSKVFNLKGYIQDTQIVEDLIFQVHTNIRDDAGIQQLFENYEEILKIRNRLVHTSAFVDNSNKIAELQPLINIKLDDVTSYLQTCVDFVINIDTMLPSDEKILLWWEYFETPIFANKEKISVLNIKAAKEKIGKLK